MFRQQVTPKGVKCLRRAGFYKQVIPNGISYEILAHFVCQLECESLLVSSSVRSEPYSHLSG